MFARFPDQGSPMAEEGLNMDDQFFMGKAIEEAEQALRMGEFPVGCVMVYENRVLVTGGRRLVIATVTAPVAVSMGTMSLMALAGGLHLRELL